MGDIQFVSSNVQDLVVFNNIFRKFELQSGAMLSRTKKSKVMGLGRWRGRQDWPLPWLQTVEELKVLRFRVGPEFSTTQSSTWEAVFRGFQRSLLSWESRAISTLEQKVKVAQTFALSKLWYVAQVLPLPPAYSKKIKSALSSFIFRGCSVRLKLAELQNPAERGGLGLTCVATKAESLLLRQCLRLLDRPEEKCYLHLGYWLGSTLKDVFARLASSGPICPGLLPRFPLHQAMAEVLQEGLMRNKYDPKEPQKAATKIIYSGRIADVVPPPKVEEKFPGVDFKDLIYPRLADKILEPESKDVLFRLVHNLIITKERMFRQNRVQDPCCPLPECQGQVQDKEHLFTSCFLVAESWVWLRTRLLRLLPTTQGAVAITNEDFLLLQFPKDVLDSECVWLLGNYCEIVTSTVIGKKRKLGAVQLAGRLRTRLQSIRGRAVVQPVLYNI